jgi:flagellar biosynthesis/type III secretory pathway M-ring protein FliF/YscJ
MTSDVVEAFAKLVSGAVAGLKPYNVNIVDARAIRSYNLPRPEDAGNAEHMRMVQKLEDRFLGKIHAKLADIPGLLASVTVELDTSKRVKQTNVHDVPQPKTETQESSEQGAGEAPTEPGFQANVGQAITASSGGKSSTETTSVENFEPKLRETETVEQGPSVRKVTAAVGIPRSFIVGIFRAGRPDAGDPRDDDPDFVALLDAQVERVRASVEKIVMAKSPGDVQVDVYPDVQWGENGPAWASLPRTTAAAGGEWTWPQPWPLFTDHLPQLGLGFLALLSLLLMWRIARRAGEPMLAGAGAVPVGPAAPEPLLASGPFPVGQAAASDGMLVGREVDDETLRYRELTTEVGRLVEDDPEAAAEMIRGWMDND